MGKKATMWGVLFIGLIAVLCLLPHRFYRLYINFVYPYPKVMEDDAVRGWKNRPGAHLFRFPSGGKVREVAFDVGASGERLLSTSPITDPMARVVVVGDSITAGWGVANEATYTAIAAKQFPRVEFTNQGVGGYGTYQSLLTLKQLYTKEKAPEIVVLGLSDFQTTRNTASLHWRTIAFIYSNRGHVRMPYVRLRADGSLEAFPPVGDQGPPGCRLSAYLCGTYFHWFKSGSVPPDASEEENNQVIAKLLTQMNRWAVDHSSRFLVAILDAGSLRHRSFLERERIPFVVAGPYHTLPDDFHPSEAYHADLGAKLAARLAPWLR